MAYKRDERKHKNLHKRSKEPYKKSHSNYMENTLFHEDIAVLQQSVGNNVVAQMFSNVIQRTIDKDHKTKITTLAELNTALGNLTPQVAPVALGDFPAGTTSGILDSVIADHSFHLFNSQTRQDIINLYTDEIESAIDSTPPNYHYDTHGDKHFPGGTHGSKFTKDKDTVNPLIEGLITPSIGRIRRDAAGNDTNYYLTAPAINHCPKKYITVQITYVCATDTIDYHGYPDANVQKCVLARSKGGTAI